MEVTLYLPDSHNKSIDSLYPATHESGVFDPPGWVFRSPFVCSMRFHAVGPQPDHRHPERVESLRGTPP